MTLWGIEGECYWNIGSKFNFISGKLLESRTQRHRQTSTHSQKFKVVLHSYRLTVGLASTHLVKTCSVKVAASHSQWQHTSKSFFSNWIWQPGSKPELYWVRQRIVSELTPPPSRTSFMGKPIHSKNREMPQRDHRQTHKHKQRTHTQTCTAWISTFGVQRRLGAAVRGDHLR